MGTRMAPAYANIFMYTIEEKIINQLPEIILWRRFIDDIICVFEQNEICDPNYILEIANEIIPEIQFTLETVDGKQVNFLDTTLTLTPDEITSSPYIKPTDKRLYVRMDSCTLIYHWVHCIPPLIFYIGFTLIIHQLSGLGIPIYRPITDLRQISIFQNVRPKLIGENWSRGSNDVSQIEKTWRPPRINTCGKK